MSWWQWTLWIWLGGAALLYVYMMLHFDTQSFTFRGRNVTKRGGKILIAVFLSLMWPFALVTGNLTVK